jgi:hypothetical protein
MLLLLRLLLLLLSLLLLSNSLVAAVLSQLLALCVMPADGFPALFFWHCAGCNMRHCDTRCTAAATSHAAPRARNDACHYSLSRSSSCL